MIDANSIYRGEEHKSALVKFLKMRRRNTAPRKMNVSAACIVWFNANMDLRRASATLSSALLSRTSPKGETSSIAVTSFESKVAPTNYKRTSAVITPGMVKKAMETIESLGLESAFERRFAVIGDISVNDVKWVDGAVKPLMKGGIGDVLMQHAPHSESQEHRGGREARRRRSASTTSWRASCPRPPAWSCYSRASTSATSCRSRRLCSPEPKQLFRWSNDFAWSYGGNVADSIKERVKKAGGKVDGATLRVSLSWYNFDDLDLHIKEPAGRGTMSVL
jgi:hypothetical protein